MQDSLPFLFWRDPKTAGYLAYKGKLSKTINARNVLTVRPSAINCHLTVAERDLFLAYRFELVREWIASVSRRDFFFGFALAFILRRLYLRDQLNAHEVNYLSGFHNTLFTRQRGVRNLPVDFGKLPKEVVGFHYDNVAIFQVIAGTRVTVIENGDVYFTNQRIYLSSELFSFSMPNESVVKTALVGAELFITRKSGTDFVIVCESPEVLQISFDKMKSYNSQDFLKNYFT